MAIQLQIDRILQGSFELQALNLIFVFQVNCPGCFLYGFPFVNKLHERYREAGLNVLGLSTAFEDFELNTAANTELLLTQKQTVGATRQSIGADYELAIDFPIAVVTLIQKSGQISKMKKKGEKPQNEYKTTPTIHRRAKS
jgi:peroxiredoxin